MSDDPWTELGLAPGCSPEDVRAARRRLAKRHHPDAGGDANRMRSVNEAAARALAMLSAQRPRTASSQQHDTSSTAATDPAGTSSRIGDDAPHASDVPSFTVEALPAETFEALRVVAAWLGEEVDDDPPYRLDTLLGEPIPCWCRLDLVPDAGASTVSITIGRHEGHRLPSIESVRDAWVDALNRLGEEPLPW